MISNGEYSLLISKLNIEKVIAVSIFKPLMQESLSISFHSGIHFTMNMDCHYHLSYFNIWHTQHKQIQPHPKQDLDHSKQFETVCDLDHMAMVRYIVLALWLGGGNISGTNLSVMWGTLYTVPYAQNFNLVTNFNVFNESVTHSAINIYVSMSKQEAETHEDSNTWHEQTI
jgi:hypothetical protein